MGLPDGSMVKNLPANARRCGFNPGVGKILWRRGYPLQYSCLKIPWTEEPGGPQSVGLQRVRHD